MIKSVLKGLVVLGLLPAPGLAFDSGSTGADGDFAPTSDTTVTLPADGILNYNSINIPTGVTVRFARNAANTPVYLLVKGDATIAGAIDVSGGTSADNGTAGDGNLNDDGMPGHGGPGGYDGGAGGYSVGPTAGLVTRGGNGQGPGGGQGNDYLNSCYGYAVGYSAAGGGYATAGGDSVLCGNNIAKGGQIYGNKEVQPLMGGSGGGGSGGSDSYLRGLGGGGGGGALLLAVTGTLNLSGTLRADGGASGGTGPILGSITGYGGGGGSGGAVRILGTSFHGNGKVQAIGGGANWAGVAGVGGAGRIRIETDANFFTGSYSPAAILSTQPSAVFLSSPPTLTISKVAGFDVPAPVTAQSEVTVPAATANPVDVVVQASGIPLDTLVSVVLKPEVGAAAAATAALNGTLASSAATVQVDLPDGAGILEASTSFVVTVALGQQLATYAGNERVERIRLVAAPGKPQQTTLITVSGKTFLAPPGLFTVRG